MGLVFKIIIGWLVIGLTVDVCIFIKVLNVAASNGISKFKTLWLTMKYDWRLLLLYFIGGPISIFSISNLLYSVTSNIHNNIKHVYTDEFDNFIEHIKDTDYNIVVKNEIPFIESGTLYFPRIKRYNADTIDELLNELKTDVDIYSDTIYLYSIKKFILNSSSHYIIMYSVDGVSDFENAEYLPIITSSVKNAIEILKTDYAVIPNNSDSITANSMRDEYKIISMTAGEIKNQFSSDKYGKDKRNIGIFFGLKYGITESNGLDSKIIAIPIVISRKKIKW